MCRIYSLLIFLMLLLWNWSVNRSQFDKGTKKKRPRNQWLWTSESVLFFRLVQLQQKLAWVDLFFAGEDARCIRIRSDRSLVPTLVSKPSFLFRQAFFLCNRQTNYPRWHLASTAAAAASKAVGFTIREIKGDFPRLLGFSVFQVISTIAVY